MLRTLTISMTALLFTSGACSKAAPCEDLATRLCDASSAHCDDARTWLATQGAGEAEARDAACAAVLADESAVAAYVARFTTAMAPAASPAPSPTVVTTPTAPAAAPPHDPTTREQVEEAGKTIEEIGNAGEKAGAAIDKIGGALSPDAH